MPGVWGVGLIGLFGRCRNFAFAPRELKAVEIGVRAVQGDNTNAGIVDGIGGVALVIKWLDTSALAG